MREREGGTADSQRVWRLVCAVTDECVRVVSRRQVEMTLPPSDPLEDIPAGAGFWVELRDAHGQPRYRRVMADPFESDIEVPGEPCDPSFTRRPAPPGGAFAILVPDLADADHVSLMRGGPAAADTPTEVARLPLAADDAGPTGTSEEEG